jgi:MscS family membrane protein
MDTRRLNRVLLLALFFARATHAQLPVASQKPPEVREESSEDRLGRSTPRGTLLGFMRAADSEDYDRAVSYLETSQQGDLARELAKQLQVVLNRGSSIDLDKLSGKPEGNLLDTQNPNRELIGLAKTSTGDLPLWLQRVQRQNNPPIWLFSRDTLQHVPEAYKYLENSPGIERNLPSGLTAELLSRPLWLWCIVLVSIPLVLVLGWLFGRLLKPLLKTVANRFLGKTEIDSVQGLVDPLQLLLLGILLLVGSDYAYTLRTRNFWRGLATYLIIFGVTWLSMRGLSIASKVYLARLQKTHAWEKIALAALLGRMLQIAVFIIGILTILYSAGINLVAALAGLGIGGLALAFAAQKTLENLFGGIMIISDRPVNIGDRCKIGDVVGTIVDIGLRSTRIRTLDRTIVTIPNGQLATMNLENFTLRDKYWFHPTISLVHPTTVGQMETVLRNIRDLLGKDPHAESGTLSARFIGVGSTSRDIGISACIFAVDYEDFLAIQEQLLLRILEIVESAGTALALPLQRT